MNIEYSFKSLCYPVNQAYECILNSPCDLSTCFAYDKLLEILAAQGVNTKRVHELKYKLDKAEQWKAVKREPIVGLDKSKKIFLKIIVKPCFGQTEKEINLRFKKLENENEELRSSLEKLQKFVYSNFPGLSSLSNCELVAQKSSEVDLKELSLIPHTASFSSAMDRIPSMNQNTIKDPDIAYLYAFPMVKEDDKKKKEALKNSIDGGKELEALQEEVKASRKELILKVDVGTLDNLTKAIEMKPKILHISCHGGYEFIDGTAKIYLYLENNEMTGVNEKYDEETIRKWFLPEKGNEIFPKLVFVSACYSEQFGKIIFDAGINNVIAIHSHTQIVDEAATRFATKLYHHLLQGKTVKEAFEKAKDDGKKTFKKIENCCCMHKHKDCCKWIAHWEDSDKSHLIHAHGCSCDFGGNIHLESCQWVKEMRKKDFMIEPFDKNDNKKYCKVCCCDPLGLPHNEEEKFLLLTRNEDEKLFDEKTPIGMASIHKCYTEEFVPSLDEVLIGRTLEMHMLVEFLASTIPGKQLICIVGPQGVGKTLLIRNAVKYTIERGRFSEGYNIIYLSSISRLCSCLNSELFPPPYTEARDLPELGRKLKMNKKIILLESDSVMATNAEELVKKLKVILQEGTGIKIIITAKKKVPDLEVDEIIINENLSKDSAYNIIKLKNSQWKTSYNRYNESKLSEKLNTPWLIIKAAHLLKSNTTDGVYNKLFTNEDRTFYDSYANSIADVVKQCGDLNSLCLLCQMPSGILHSNLIEILNKNENKCLQSMKDFITDKNQPTTLILTSVVKDLNGELRYTPTENAIDYVNNTLLKHKKAVPYQCLCLGKLATITRNLVRSYNINEYKSLAYDEFSAIVDDGIWACHTKYPGSTNEKDLPSQPMLRFQSEKETISAFLDQPFLNAIVREISGLEIGKFLDNVRELAICTVTLLLHLRRPVEALQVADAIQGFAYTLEHATECENLKQTNIKEKLQEIQAIAKLLKAGMAISQNRVIEKKDALKEVEDAELLFGSAGRDSVGVGETLYLHAVLLLSDEGRNNENLADLKCAKDIFAKENNQICLARVLIAESMFLFNKEKSENIIETLNEALRNLQGKKYIKYLKGQCYLERAKNYKSLKKYDEAGKDLLKASKNFIFVQNKQRENECERMNSLIAEEKQKDSPLFAFLKAFPIVKKRKSNISQVESLEPNIRQPSFFRQDLIEGFNIAQKAIRVVFDTFTLNTLSQILTQSCTVLHISSDHYKPGSISFEGELGELEQVPLTVLKEKLAGIVKRSQCKVIVVAIPDAEDIANAFSELGVPHVVYFKFTEGKLSNYEDRIDVLNLKYASIYKFCVGFYTSLLEENTVEKSRENAKNVMEEYVWQKGSYLQIPNLHYEIANAAMLLPTIKSHHETVILPNLKQGSYIDTSPKRGYCEIEKEKKPFVGRQKELYEVAKALRGGHCVNLYGHNGVGKTRFANELGYFMYMHFLFKSGIYRRIVQVTKEAMNDILSSNNDSSANSEDNKILVIIDNFDNTLWKKEKYRYKFIAEDRNCVFLFITSTPLETNNENPLIIKCLRPFMEDILSVEFIFSYLEQNNFSIREGQLNVQKHTRKAIREAITHTLGFQQANGNPNILETFCQKIMKSEENISEIDLARSYRTKFKRITARPNKLQNETNFIRKASDANEQYKGIQSLKAISGDPSAMYHLISNEESNFNRNLAPLRPESCRIELERFSPAPEFKLEDREENKEALQENNQKNKVIQNDLELGEKNFTENKLEVISKEKLGNDKESQIPYDLAAPNEGQLDAKRRSKCEEEERKVAKKADEVNNEVLSCKQKKKSTKSGKKAQKFKKATNNKYYNYKNTEEDNNNNKPENKEKEKSGSDSNNQ